MSRAIHYASIKWDKKDPNSDLNISSEWILLLFLNGGRGLKYFDCSFALNSAKSYEPAAYNGIKEWNAKDFIVEWSWTTAFLLHSKNGMLIIEVIHTTVVSE